MVLYIVVEESTLGRGAAEVAQGSYDHEEPAPASIGLPL